TSSRSTTASAGSPTGRRTTAPGSSPRTRRRSPGVTSTTTRFRPCPRPGRRGGGSTGSWRRPRKLSRVSVGERLSFPRQQARTRRFTLGLPRAFRIAADGSRVLFLRSPAGDDPVTQLWCFDVATGKERLVCDPALLGQDGEVPPEERARRERVR